MKVNELTGGKKTASQRVLEILGYLKRCLEERWLVHHFIENLNLLAGASPQTIQKNLEIVSRIIEDPFTHITIDSRSLEIFNAIAQEVSELNSLLSTGTKTSEESYTEVSSLFAQKMNLHAKNVRFNLLSDIYKYTGMTKMAERVIKAQELQLSVASDTGKSATQGFIQVNNENLEKNRQLLKIATSKAELVLGEIAALYGMNSCMRCDICQGKNIPCKQERFKCNSTCDFDVCTQCMDCTGITDKPGAENSLNTIEEENEEIPQKSDFLSNNPATQICVTTSLHEHPLQQTSKCSLYCYTNYNHMKFGLNADQAFMANMMEGARLIEETSKLYIAIGTTSKKHNSLMDGDNSTLSELLQQLYTDLSLSYKATKGKS